jgi:SAM-dependent methyltransferase
MPAVLPTHTSEIERIRAEYRRRGREIPVDFYAWNRPVNLYTQTQLMRDMLKLLDQQRLFPLKTLRVADIGCGGGVWLLEFAQWGAEAQNLAGIDLNEKRVADAARTLPGADLRVGSADTLPWADASFDLVSQFTLFSSILSESLKQTVASEMMRILKPGGSVLWYDLALNNPRNPNVRGIGLAETQHLFPGCEVLTRRVTLAPPLARLIVPASWIVASMLEKLPFLRTHNLHLIRKPASTKA